MKRFLQDHGAPVAKSAFINFDTLNTLRSAKSKIKNYIQQRIDKTGLTYPFVIKPINDKCGHGVYTGLSTIDQIMKSINHYIGSGSTSHLLLEEQIQGTAYRVLYVNKKLIAIASRDVPFVVGDGKTKVLDLVTIYNDALKSGTSKLHPIEINDQYIASQGYNKDSIPAPNTRVYIDNILNYLRGAITRTVPINSIHSDNYAMFEKVLRAYDSNCLGIDYVSPDISKSYKDVRSAILEFNSDPARGLHDITDKDFEKRYMAEINAMRKERKGRYDPPKNS